MIRNVHIKGFKSLHDVEIKELPRLTVLFGPNAVGKSNFLDALYFLSKAATEKSLKEATDPPMRGYPVEAFTLMQGGLPSLLSEKERSLSISVDVQLDEAISRQAAEEIRRASEDTHRAKLERLRYQLEIGILPSSGYLSVQNEYLSRLNASWEPSGVARIDKNNEILSIRRRDGKHPRNEPLGLNHAILSTPLYAPQHPEIVTMRQELLSWRFYYLEPREKMRRAGPPSDVTDIGSMGENLAPFLYRLKHGENVREYRSIVRALKTIMPSVEDLDVSLNEHRGEVEVVLTQDSVPYSTRVISEGTLRLIALLALIANPWQSAVIAFEEPENGIHPRRLQLVAELLADFAAKGKGQVIVTTHSALFCQHLLSLDREYTAASKEPLIKLYASTRDENGTYLAPYNSSIGGLFEGSDVEQGLTSREEPQNIHQRILRGDFDV